MLQSFEKRLADLLADALRGAEGVRDVRLARDGNPAAAPSAASVTVRLMDAAPTPEVGDDRPEVLGSKPRFSLRPVLHLSGEVRVELEIGPATSAVDRGAQRERLLGALDQVILALHPEKVRTGEEFATGEDQGFELDGFRFHRIASPDGARTDHRRLQAYYRYSGRFWPVGPPVEGPAILELPTRVAFLPVFLPDRLSATAGGPDLRVPIRMDLRAFGGAARRLAGRLAGETPPGSLVGDAADLPAGMIGWPVDLDGTATLLYRPPPAVAGRARARIRLQLVQLHGAGVDLGEVVVEVEGA